MRYCIFDIETNDLYQDVSKLHCLVYYSFDTENDTVASGVLTDYDAIKNAILTPFSNGLVEGINNKIKAVKRSMYGRASNKLLKIKMLHACTG